MNAVTPLKAHSYGSSATRSARDAEYDAISRVTGLLRQANGRCATVEDIRAVHLNNELWTALAFDLAQPGNALPDEVKAGLLTLASFSIRRGHACLQGEASIDALIDINLCIMKGLRGEVAA